MVPDRRELFWSASMNRREGVKTAAVLTGFCHNRREEDMLKDGSKLDILSFLELIASEDEKPRQQDWIDREGK